MGVTASSGRSTVPPTEPICDRCNSWFEVRVKLNGFRHALAGQPSDSIEQRFVFRGQCFHLQYVPDTDTGILQKIKGHQAKAARPTGQVFCEVTDAVPRQQQSWLGRVRQTVSNLLAPILDMWDAGKLLEKDLNHGFLASRSATMLDYVRPYVPVVRLQSVNVDVDKIFADKATPRSSAGEGRVRHGQRLP